MPRSARSTTSLHPATDDRLAEIHSMVRSAALRSRVAAQQVAQARTRTRASDPRSRPRTPSA